MLALRERNFSNAITITKWIFQTYAVGRDTCSPENLSLSSWNCATVARHGNDNGLIWAIFSQNQWDTVPGTRTHSHIRFDFRAFHLNRIYIVIYLLWFSIYSMWFNSTSIETTKRGIFGISTKFSDFNLQMCLEIRLFLRGKRLNGLAEVAEWRAETYFKHDVHVHKLKPQIFRLFSQ